MGLPEVIINFNSQAVSAIQRSQRGIVALVLKDEGEFETKEYKTIADIESDDWTADNLDYIQKAFLGVPSKVIVERIDVGGEDPTEVSDALNRLASKRWNYLAIPSIEGADVATVSTWIKAQRNINKKTFKAVLPNSDSDHEGIINFTTDDIVVGAKTYDTAEYTARIAGILAGLSLERSSTYFVLPEVDSIAESATPNDDIEDGELILINDGEKIKIGSGVNSLVTTTVSKSADFKKIKIIEGHDLVKEDFTRTFENDYAGRVNNSYDNQALFLAAANAYIRGLEGTVLNPNVTNLLEVDVDAQALAWESIGTDTSTWTEQQIKDNSFSNKVFVRGTLRFLDAMESITFNISV